MDLLKSKFYFFFKNVLERTRQDRHVVVVHFVLAHGLYWHLGLSTGSIAQARMDQSME